VAVSTAVADRREETDCLSKSGGFLEEAYGDRRAAMDNERE
jgi:hypothetical protein